MKDIPSRTNIKAALELQRAVTLVWSSSPAWTLASFAVLLIQGLLPLASLYLLKLIIDSLTKRSQDFQYIALLITLACLAALLTAFCRSASTLINENQGALVSDSVQDILHAQSIAVDLEYYENSRYYDSLHRAQAEAPYRPMRIVNELAQLLQNSISLASVTVLLVSFNWLLALALLIASLPASLVRLRYAGKLYAWQRSVTERERRAWYLHWLLVGTDFAKEIRLFGLGNHFKDKYHDLRSELRQEKLAMNARRSAAELATQSIAVLALFGSLLFIAQQNYAGAITVGSLVMYFGAFQQGQGFMQNLLQSLAGLYEDNLFLSDLYEFLDLEPKIVEPSSPKPIPQPMAGGISFEKVSFQYPGSSRQVLQDISLYISTGQSVALVGLNGSGKSTLVKLLCRLYDPSSGLIICDGIDIKRFSLIAWRREIGIILQDYVRYNVAAWENIWFGDVTQPVQMSRIAAAAQGTGADSVIRGLKDGYNTVLGRQFEDGVELSVGEWQKIALARVFLSHAQILVLDEPTSSLDPTAEEEVFHKFRDLAKGRTSILISHRLSTVKMADRIFFLKDGKVVESGSHQELMALGREYARLFDIQAKHYR